ncbi:hypothetical protein [Pseudomonas peli]|uniref:hypothetical protein n=1 Tax=Pseudomonas peli TaxID=592361 RepID=UPI0024ACE329|nr:hypothetical protein [Pseudomonas peli]
MDLPKKYLEQISENPISGVVKLCAYIRAMNDQHQEWSDDLIDLILQAFAALEVLISEEQVSVDTELPDVWQDSPIDMAAKALGFIHAIEQELTQQASTIKLNDYRQKFSNLLSKRPAYEFTEGDIEQIQEHVNQLRKLLQAATDLDEGHRARMLKRLEGFQSELHKKMSDLTKFFGFMGDMGVAMRKLGQDAKPIVDRYEQIIRAGWQAEARSAGLPHDSEMPRIGHEDANKLEKE